jgi:hypothetical protein
VLGGTIPIFFGGVQVDKRVSNIPQYRHISYIMCVTFFLRSPSCLPLCFLQYNIPLDLFVLEHYPHKAPEIYIRPTASESVKASWHYPACLPALSDHFFSAPSVYLSS